MKPTIKLTMDEVEGLVTRLAEESTPQNNLLRRLVMRAFDELDEEDQRAVIRSSFFCLADGAEAEDLRSELEALIQDECQCGEFEQRVQEILDRVDARDSLTYLMERDQHIKQLRAVVTHYWRVMNELHELLGADDGLPLTDAVKQAVLARWPVKDLAAEFVLDGYRSQGQQQA